MSDSQADAYSPDSTPGPLLRALGVIGLVLGILAGVIVIFHLLVATAFTGIPGLKPVSWAGFGDSLAALNAFKIQQFAAIVGLWLGLLAITFALLSVGLPAVTIWSPQGRANWVATLITTAFFGIFSLAVMVIGGGWALFKFGAEEIHYLGLPRAAGLLAIPLFGVIWLAITIWESVKLAYAVPEPSPQAQAKAKQAARVKEAKAAQKQAAKAQKAQAAAAKKARKGGQK